MCCVQTDTNANDRDTNLISPHRSICSDFLFPLQGFCFCFYLTFRLTFSYYITNITAHCFTYLPPLLDDLCEALLPILPLDVTNH